MKKNRNLYWKIASECDLKINEVMKANKVLDHGRKCIIAPLIFNILMDAKEISVEEYEKTLGYLEDEICWIMGGLRSFIEKTKGNNQLKEKEK